MSRQPSPHRHPKPVTAPDPLVGIEAKTSAYPGAKSWSGGRLRVKGLEVFDEHAYHVNKMPGI